MKTQLCKIETSGENVPFSFNMKNGGQELRPAPLAFVTSLKTMIFHLLDEKQRYMYLYIK